MSDRLKKLSEEARKSSANMQSIITSTNSTTDKVENHLVQVSREYHRVTEISHAPMVIIDDIDEQFKKATKLTSVDIAFLFVATALQIARQYLITSFPERLSDKEAANAVKGDQKEKSDRMHQWYKPSLEEILTNPVPYDAAKGAKNFGALQGFGALGHRGATPGHDPILGFVFGTANIATSTLTNWRMESYHVKTESYDTLVAHAKTPLVFSNTFDQLLYNGLEGKEKIAAAISKEFVHLKSDMYSKNSLPLPFVSIASPKLAGTLARYGVDSANIIQVGKQAAYASLINFIVAIVHGLFYDESQGYSRKLYQVRTRKVLSYSNLIASASNVVVTACTRDLNKLDIGGLAVTLFRFISDTKFISDVKREFLQKEFYDRIVGTQYDFMEG